LSKGTLLDPDGHAAQLVYMAELFMCSDAGAVNITDPRIYAAKTARNDPDMPTFQQAMNGTEAGKYIKAMKLEIHTLIEQHTWESVVLPKDKPVLKGTWAFKLKCLLDGTPYRYKARFGTAHEVTCKLRELISSRQYTLLLVHNTKVVQWPCTVFGYTSRLVIK
jgi:hypothetical protein